MNSSFLSCGRWLLLSGLCACLSVLPVRAMDNEVIVISPHWVGIQAETSRAFSAWHEKKYGIAATIRWRKMGGGTSQILRFLSSEYQANASSGIDVLYGGGVDPFRDLKQEGL